MVQDTPSEREQLICAVHSYWALGRALGSRCAAVAARISFAAMAALNEKVELRVGSAQYRAAQRLIRRVTGMRRASITIDGVTVPYLRGGRGAPLLMLHGFGDRKETFGPLAMALYRHFELIIPDFPGFGGASSVSSDRVSASAQSQFMGRFLAQLGVSRAHVMGQSMGGAIAARFADDHPGVARSLTMLSAAGPRGLSPAFESRLRSGRNPLIIRTFEDFESLCDLAFQRPLVWPRTMKRYIASQWQQRPDEHLRHFQRLNEPPPGEEVAETYPNVRCPVRLIYGTVERVVHQANITAYKDAFGGASVHMLNGVGHNPHHEATFQVARLMRGVRRV